jgi:hypothetical protein
MRHENVLMREGNQHLDVDLRSRDHSSVLLTLVTEQVVTPREALQIAAARVAAKMCGLSGTLLHVFVLVPVKILRVEEALTAD